MSFKTLLHRLKKTEKIILTFLLVIFLGASFQVGKAFYLDNTEAEYVEGGTYVEGAVGEISSLNPLFVQQGSVSQDLSDLIFSGLTKYNPQTGEIVPDLATFKRSEDGKTYDFVLKDGVKWHDGKLFTADDVMFTYQTVIKNREFKGNILNYNDYSDVSVAKVDERTIQFTLEKPDAFFLAKTTVGILPKHLLENEPISLLDKAAFNLNPIGTGPYKFVSQIPFPTYIEYSLESFSEYHDAKPRIQNVLLKIFPNHDELEKNIKSLDGIRTIPEDFIKKIKEHDQFVLDTYELPQYVAVFINNEAPKVKEVNVRLGLKLGTDKKALIEAINQQKVIDTPLLEIDQENWVNQYSVKKANGALFETEWQVPNKDTLEQTGQDLVETEKKPSATSEVTFITSPNNGKDWKTTLEPITISGKVPEGAKSLWIGDYQLQKFKPGDTEWDYVAAKKFDSLVDGKNVYEVFAEDQQGKKTLIDAITIQFENQGDTTDSEDKTRIEEENAQAVDLPTRENKDGEKLVLKLVTSKNPASYAKVAEVLKEQWKKIGVEIEIEVLEGDAFQQKLAKREYDLLLFGQNLGYNLDAYPYWHSSQAKKEDQEATEGLNLSQFKNFAVDSLLEQARLASEEGRKKTLEETQEIISQEVPAIFLYSPAYHTALSKDIKYPEFKHLATTSDRLANIEDWFGQADRHFKEGVNVFTFFSWAARQL